MSLAALRVLMTSPTRAGDSRSYWGVPLMLSVAEVNQLLSVALERLVGARSCLGVCVDDEGEVLGHHLCGEAVERSRCVGVGSIGEGG